MKILLAVDGSPYTQKMLDYLAAHAEWLGDTHSYTALTVQPPLPPRAAKALGKELVGDYYAEEAQKALNPVHKFLETHHLDGQCESKIGHIAETIAEMAYLTRQINPNAPRLKDSLIKKHYERKHGKNAYYGQ